VTTKHKLKNYTDLFNGEGGGGGLGLPRAPCFLKPVLNISMDHKLMCPLLSVNLNEQQIMSLITEVQTKYTSKNSKMGRPCCTLKLGSSKDMNPRTRVLHRITLVLEHDRAQSFLGQVQITVTSQVFVIQETQKSTDTNCNKW
jgi:hypothetical protein